MTPEQKNLLRLLIIAILEAIRAAGPSGAPEGVLFSALMTYGCTQSDFDSFMAHLENAGLVRREHWLYFVTSDGEDVLNSELS